MILSAEDKYITSCIGLTLTSMEHLTSPGLFPANTQEVDKFIVQYLTVSTTVNKARLYNTGKVFWLFIFCGLWWISR